MVDKLIKKISVSSLIENIIDSFKINNIDTSENVDEFYEEDKNKNKEEYSNVSKSSNIKKILI